MRCARCPLYRSWNNESDSGESCGLFGDGWDSQFQYEDKNGTTQGCYIDRHYIDKADNDYTDYLDRMVDAMVKDLECSDGGDCELWA